MRRKRSYINLIFLLTLVLTMSFTALAADTVELGTLMPLTGGLASYGQYCQKGTILAQQIVNQQGGLLDGKKLELVNLDTQTNPQAGVDAAQKLVSINGVAGIVGALSSGVTIPVAESVAIPNKVVLISPASTSPVITTLDDNGFVFRTVPSDSLQGVVVGDLAVDQGYKKMAIVYVNNDYGEGLADAVAQEFKKKGGEITASIGFEPNKVSYRGELAKASKGNPDVLFLVAYTDDGGITIIRQSLEEGYFQKFIFSDGLKAPEIADGIEQYLDGMLGTAPTALPGGNGPEIFKSLYNDEYGEIPPKPYIDTSFDATFILAMAIEKAGKATGPAIRDAINELFDPAGETVTINEWAKAKKLIDEGKKIKYEGASGPVSFNEVGDSKGAIGIWKIKDGDIVSEDLVIK